MLLAPTDHIINHSVVAAALQVCFGIVVGSDACVVVGIGSDLHIINHPVVAAALQV